jgi:predicted outer membrane protein
MLRNLGFAAAVLAAMVSSASAQQTAPATPGQNPAMLRQMVDAAVADCLVLANQEEITLCKWAADRLKSDEAKDLAKEMEQDHEKYITQLRRFATKGRSFELRASSGSSESTASTGTSKIQQVAGTRESTTAGAPRSLHDQMYQIEHKAHEQCLKLTQECLGKEKGSNFDQAFLGQQIGMHIAVQARLMAVQDEVSPEFQQVVREGVKTTKEHKEKLEKLMHQLAEKERKS